MNTLLLFVIVAAAAVWIFQKRLGILLLLLMFCPTILVHDQSWGERLSTGIQDMGISISLFTYFDILIEFLGHNYGMVANQGNPYYDVLFVIEIYSVLLVLFLYVSLCNYNLKGIHGNFKLYAKKFYTTYYFWGSTLACCIAIFMLTDTSAKHISSFHFSNQHLIFEAVYLIIYFILLIVVMRHYFFLTPEEKFLALFLVLLFPITGFSGEFKAVTNIGMETYTFENHVAVYPLLYSITKNLNSLYTYFTNENYSINKTAMIYGILQSAAVLYLFPSLLNVNQENNYKL